MLLRHAELPGREAEAHAAGGIELAEDAVLDRDREMCCVGARSTCGRVSKDANGEHHLSSPVVDFWDRLRRGKSLAAEGRSSGWGNLEGVAHQASW